MTDNVRTGLAAKFSLWALSLAALGCLLGAALLATSTPARAGDDDENVPIDTKIIRGLFENLGLQRDGAGINYQERPPLVIPPNHDLPPPEAADAALARNPAWPVDPDVQRRKQEAAAERKVTMNPDAILLKEQRPLRPDEMAPGPKPRTVRQTDDGYRPSPNGYGGVLPPDKLGVSGFFGKMFGKEEPVAHSFTGEPSRSALTDPPPGYQTPSPDQPYGVTKTKAPAPTSADYILNHPVGDTR